MEPYSRAEHARTIPATSFLSWKTPLKNCRKRKEREANKIRATPLKSLEAAEKETDPMGESYVSEPN